MFERILLPLDGSELSEMALPYGEELASKLGSELILYHVHGHEQSQQEHMHQMYLDRLAETVQRNVRKGQPKGIEVKVTTKVEAGAPTENICNLVDKNEVDLIIMTAVSASGLNMGKMLGSVTDHICQTVPIPVMLIRPQSVKQTDKKKRLINRMLIPLDGSDLSKLVLPIGEELATKLKVPITLFQMARVIYPYYAGVDPIMGGMPAIEYSKFSRDEERQVRAEIVALEKELRKKGLRITHRVISGFDAANEIIEVGKNVYADLVVMSTHGRSGLRRWVSGSVAEKVLRHGETPLLLVHARAG
jgi:nucleotide-binding universal stress UspA family protein